MRTLTPLVRETRGRGNAPVKRDQVWQRDNVANLRSLAGQRIASLVEAIGGAGALIEIQRYVSGRRDDSSMHAQLDAFCHLIEALDALAGTSLDVDVARELLGAGRAILGEQAIDPRRSRLAELCADLERCAAKIAHRSRDLWSASWHEALANMSSGQPPPSGRSAEVLALLAGDAPALVGRVLEHEVITPDSTELRAMRARLLRLSGRNDGARAVLAANVAGNAVLEWELALSDAVRTGELHRMATLLRKPAHKSPDRQLDFWLWAHATSTRRYRRESVKLATIARRLDGDVAALACARAIESLTRRTSEPLERLRRLGVALRKTTEIGSVQRELLVWAAAARCLVAAKQPRFASVAAARYAGLSRVASAGATADVLGLRLGVLDADEVSSWSTLELGLRTRRLPKRARDRYFEVGKMTLNLFRARLAHATRQSSEHHEWQRDAFGLINDHLGHLKGPLLKLGQLMSHYGLGLSEEERASLHPLFDQATVGIDERETARLIESEIGPIERAFSELDLRPFAAGSIGQVHRASTLEGRRVAVKVQYPGIESVVAADLKLLRVLAPLFDLAKPKMRVSALLDELETMVVAECDYRAEARNQRRFAAMFDDRDDIVIPRVLDSHSSRRVLTTELFEGKRVDEFVATADPLKRQWAAARLARFIVRTGIIRRCGHTDPHPGNFLIGPDALCVLDFGSAKEWPEGQWQEVLLSCMNNDVAGLQTAFRAMGMVGGELDFAAIMASLRRHTMKWTLADAPTAFGPDDVAEEIKTWLLDGQMSNLVLQPRDLFGFRMYWGAFAMLAKLDVAVDLASIVREELALAASG